MAFEFKLLGKGCEGWLDWPPCEQLYGFGHEGYLHTQVMACCEEWDESEDQAAVVREYCMGDLIEQICLSASEQLTVGANMLEDGAVKEGVIDLQNYVADHIGACIEALWANDTDPAPDAIVSKWELGDMKSLSGIKLVVDSGSISGFSLPDSPTECGSNQENNMETFMPPLSAPVAPTTVLTLHQSGRLVVVGPELFGSRAHAAGSLAAADSFDCARVSCSTLELVAADPEPMVTRLDLVTAGPVVLGNDLGSEVIESSRVELRAGAKMSRSDDGAFQIAVGGAHFVVLGEVDGSVRRVAGANSERLVLTHVGAAWHTSEFDITVIDDQGQQWVIEIPASEWH